MPEKMERELKKTAKKKFPGDKDRQNAYIYGTMRKTGWKPSGEEKAKKTETPKLHHSVGAPDYRGPGYTDLFKESKK
jgi:hypothetical protein